MGVGEIFHSLMMRSPSFSVPLDCELQKYFVFFPPHLTGSGWLEWDGVGHLPSLCSIRLWLTNGYPNFSCRMQLQRCSLLTKLDGSIFLLSRKSDAAT